ncbi:MAG TPA: hypothetical protein VGG82_07590 [Casimicrobiaceae bacterium]
MIERDEVQPTPEPSREPFDPHLGPLDNDDDVRWLRDDDPRRIARDKGEKHWHPGKLLHKLRGDD